MTGPYQPNQCPPLYRSRSIPYGRPNLDPTKAERTYAKNRERRNKEIWLSETGGKINQTILIPTKSSIETCKEIEKAFYTPDAKRAKEEIKDTWMKQLREQMKSEKFTWRLLDRITQCNYTTTFRMHGKMTATYGEIINTGLMQLRTGQYCFALPPFNTSYNITECHLFSLFNSTFAHPMLLDQTEYTDLLHDCLHAHRWIIFMRRFMGYTEKDGRQLPDTATADQPDTDFGTMFPGLIKEPDDANDKAALAKYNNATWWFQEELNKCKDFPQKKSKNQFINYILHEKPLCQTSGFLRWLTDYKFTLTELEELYYYLTLCKPIGKILSHIHPHNYSQVSPKVNIGRAFIIKYES